METYSLIIIKNNWLLCYCNWSVHVFLIYIHHCNNNLGLVIFWKELVLQNPQGRRVCISKVSMVIHWWVKAVVRNKMVDHTLAGSPGIYLFEILVSLQIMLCILIICFLLLLFCSYSWFVLTELCATDMVGSWLEGTKHNLIAYESVDVH